MNDLSVIEAEFGDMSQYGDCPDYWPATPEMGKPLLDALKQANTHVIGTSAGGREIIAIEYGEKEELDATSKNLQSTMASKLLPVDVTEIYPPAFFGHTRRRKPVLMLQGGIHGGELTGTVASLNLCNIIETGKDLRGKDWPKLAELARDTRICIIPWLNPDGTARWPLTNGTGATAEMYMRCTQGVAKDGTKYLYPAVKSICPIPPEETAFMGSYYNDAGINLQYDFCEPQRQPETTAWIEYYLAEKPDGSLIFHCDGGSIISLIPYFSPPGYQQELSRLGGAVRNRLLSEGHEIGRLSWAGLPGLGKPTLSQVEATYFVCGCLPILCELPTAMNYSLEDLLDIGLLTIEQTLIHAHTAGLRPYESWEKVRSKLK